MKSVKECNNFFHVDLNGKLLDRTEHKFVYVPSTTMDCAEVNVTTPFSDQPLKDILPVSTIHVSMYSSFVRPIGGSIP